MENDPPSYGSYGGYGGYGSYGSYGNCVRDNDDDKSKLWFPPKSSNKHKRNDPRTFVPHREIQHWLFNFECIAWAIHEDQRVLSNESLLENLGADFISSILPRKHWTVDLIGQLSLEWLFPSKAQKWHSILDGICQDGGNKEQRPHQDIPGDPLDPRHLWKKITCEKMT